LLKHWFSSWWNQLIPFETFLLKPCFLFYENNWFLLKPFCWNTAFFFMKTTDSFWNLFVETLISFLWKQLIPFETFFLKQWFIIFWNRYQWHRHRLLGSRGNTTTDKSGVGGRWSRNDPWSGRSLYVGTTIHEQDQD
jgi:hypothetical protein